jgi:hypothetical protein
MPQASGSQVMYRPRPDATPETEAAALAEVYAFVLRCAEERKKGGCWPPPRQAAEIKVGVLEAKEASMT